MQINLPIVCERPRGSVSLCWITHIRHADIAIVLHRELPLRIQDEGVHGRDSFVHELVGAVVPINELFLAAVPEPDRHACLFFSFNDSEAIEAKAHVIYTDIAATRKVTLAFVLEHSGNLHKELKVISLVSEYRQGSPTYRFIRMSFKLIEVVSTEINPNSHPAFFIT